MYSIDPLNVYLLPKGKVPGIGPEIGSSKTNKNGIIKYRSIHGSYRYLYFKNNKPISVLQVVSKDKKHAVIANVFTIEDERRKGYALLLLKRARQDFKTVKHASIKHRTTLGKLWSKSVRDMNTSHSKFIQKKIKILIDEGYKPKQAVAIAYRMAGESRTKGKHTSRDTMPFSSKREAEVFQHALFLNGYKRALMAETLDGFAVIYPESVPKHVVAAAKNAVFHQKQNKSRMRSRSTYLDEAPISSQRDPDDYETNERKIFRQELLQAEKGTAVEKREAAQEFLNDMRTDPKLIGERIGWLLTGQYGWGSRQAAREVLAREGSRSNKVAWFTKTVAALEWHVPQRLAQEAWKKLSTKEKARLKAHVTAEFVKHRLRMRRYPGS